MARTRPEINLRLFDTTAFGDATYSATDIQPFIDISQLKEDFVSPDQYATLELNQWSLDGSKVLFPDDMTTLDFGFWSRTQSDNSNNLSVLLNINFTQNHTSIGLTFYFYPNDHAVNFNVKWFNAADELIVQKDFVNNIGEVFFASQVVENYRRIEILFTTVDKSVHYLKLRRIEFGADLFFDEDSIQRCQIVEEVDPVSNEVSINTMKFTAFVTDQQFIQDVYSVLQDQQELICREIVGSNTIEMGTFFLQKRFNPSANEIRFETTDLIGLMSNTPYLGGIINGTVESILNAIFADFGTTKFTIADELKNLNISGYIPITEHRRAIQLIAFAINAVVDDSRGDTVRIFRLPTSGQTSIANDRYFIQNDQQEERERFTDIDLSITQYETNSDNVHLYNATVVAGTFTTTFNEPHHNYSITGGVITASGSNFVTFTSTGSTVTISGQGYNSFVNRFVVQKQNLPANVNRRAIEFENTIQWDGVQNAQNLFNRLIDQDQREVRLITNTESVGDLVTIDALYNQNLQGYIESMDIDLAGGFISRTVIGGVLNGS